MSTPSPAPAQWKVGTLTYTKAALIALVIWLLWGDLAWWMRERSAAPMMQLLLKKFHASDLITGLMLITLPNLIWIILGPIISIWSDNHRGRWGRRIPFLLATTPLVSVAMIGLGLSPEIGALLHEGLGPKGFSLEQCALIVIGLCWCIFEIGALTANAIFTALINDVVPRVMIGRFFGIFRAISLGTGILFNSKIIGHADVYFREIFIGIGIFYAVGLALMCLKVKEGTYDPPPPLPPGNPLLNAMKSYLRDCFTSKYYLWGMAFFALGNLAFVPVNTFSLSAAKSYGMSLEAFGNCFVISFIASFVLAYPIGWLADRFHPLRVGIVAALLYAIGGFASFFLIRDSASFGYALLAHVVLSGCFFTGTAALCQVIFPKLKFAQFTAASWMVNALCQILLGPVFGWFLDLTGNDYRYAFLSGAGIALVTLLCGLILKRSKAPLETAAQPSAT